MSAAGPRQGADATPSRRAGATAATPGEFDVFDCPLDGVNLIEASAGTGKTWNICGLYLRLLLERGLDVKEILVVTFTNAATAELRARIRARIVETLAWLRGAAAARANGDPFVARLVAAVAGRSRAGDEALIGCLDRALESFDEASIFTIHGFCQRALADASFSAGLPFRLELVTDDDEMLMEAVHDFWRLHIADASCPPPLAAYLQSRNDTPEKYAKLLRRSLAKPLARCLWPATPEAPPTLDTAAVADAYAAARALWLGRQAEIVATVRAALPVLHAGVYKEALLAQAQGDWDAWFDAEDPLAPLPDKSKLHLLSAAVLDKSTKQKQKNRPPEHAFFAAAEALLAARVAATATLESARMALVRALLETVAPRLRERKRARRVVAFDDMLHNLYDALTDGEHPALAAELRRRHPVALIDEFQDTDPLQYAIFDRIHRAGGASVFFVGDPKQAIYSFRNADLHAYLAAREGATAEYTLADNQRSTGGLIAALNGLFETNPAAFMLEGLAYRPVAMGAKPRKPFVDASEARADLQLWWLPAGADGVPIRKPMAKAQAVRATAVEIARLIAEGGRGRITIDGEPLRSGDIAVLVRTHAQGSELKRELARLNVGSVELAQASVFQSPDAEEVERVLIAINEPSRETLLRGALATEMLGCDAGQIAAISGEEARLLDYLERFAGYRDLWLRHGVGVMYRRFLTDEGVSARMLARDDGERRLTNLLHLGEQLHQAAVLHPSPDALLRWLAAQRRAEAVDEIAQLRLESDRNLVQIVTIHKAKGLEFPIVFCPFVWEGGTRFGGPKPEGREYHDGHGRAVVDFRFDEEIGDEKAAIDDAVRIEAAAESLRLVYVALTRAVYRCYAIAGIYTTSSFGRPSVAESTKSVLNWLVAGGADAPTRWLANGRPATEIADAWKALAAGTPQIGLADLPTGPGRPVVEPAIAPEALRALPPPRSIAPAWRYGSFTGLLSDAASEAAASDHDAHAGRTAPRAGAAPPEVAADDVLRFPRGPGAGDCLHAILERIDFNAPDGWPAAIARGLDEHPQFLPGVPGAEQRVRLAAMARRMLGDVLGAPLPDGIVLGSVAAARRLAELEFTFPSPSVSAAALNATLKALGYAVPRLAFGSLEGYLRGYIDLVFEHGGRWYVLDWKSNHLGWTPADYGADALAAAMEEHGYHLQYLLYTLALHRYLRHRVPGYSYEAHFGGVLYLFLRGVRPGWTAPGGTSPGVFFERPKAHAIARLDALFAGRPGKARA